MRILSITALAALVLLNFGCAGLSIDLEEKGKSVKIDNTLTEQQKAELTKTTSVKCKLGKNGRPYSNNKLACENDLRNKLAKTGSDIVTIEVAPADPANFYCNNCIEMTGTGYKSKNAGKASEPETVAAPDLPKELPKTGEKVPQTPKK